MTRASGAPNRVVLERAFAALITAVALFIFINGAFFSSFSALHIDLSINLTAAHALRDGADPYGPTTLLERAESLGSPTNLIYGQLFTSYIQPPTSALSLLPLTVLDWREATRLYLLLNIAFLAAAVVITLCTLRPTLPLRCLIAGASVIVALYSQVYGSFALGQVDATILLLLTIGFWAYTRDKPAIAGSAIAIAAAIKLLPALLLLYFLWKRDYKAAVWGAGVGVALLAVSFAYTGHDTYHSYVADTLPALSKGSTHYSNASLGAVIARRSSPEVIRDLPAVLYLDEVPSDNTARIASTAVVLAALAALAVLIKPGPLRMSLQRQSSTPSYHPESVEGRSATPVTDNSSSDAHVRSAPIDKTTHVWEYYLVVAVALLISSVTWEFYVIWLLPVFLAAFLAPSLLPPSPLRWLILAVLTAVLIALNYPGDFYLFDVNDFFYHPDWVPGVWVEDRVQLYHKHLDAVLYLRLTALLLLTGVLAALTRWRQQHPV